jgi:hypothetical protein
VSTDHWHLSLVIAHCVAAHDRSGVAAQDRSGVAAQDRSGAMIANSVKGGTRFSTFPLKLWGSFQAAMLLSRMGRRRFASSSKPTPFDILLREHCRRWPRIGQQRLSTSGPRSGRMCCSLCSKVFVQATTAEHNFTQSNSLVRSDSVAFLPNLFYSETIFGWALDFEGLCSV